MICLLIRGRCISGTELDQNQDSCIFWSSPSESFSFLLSMYLLQSQWRDWQGIQREMYRRDLRRKKKLPEISVLYICHSTNPLPKLPKLSARSKYSLWKFFDAIENFSYFPAIWLHLGRIAYKSPGPFPRPTVISESSRWKELTQSIFELSSPVCNFISLLFLHPTS